MKRYLFPLVFLILTSTRAFASDGNELYRMCQENSSLNSPCLGYIVGVVEGLNTMNSIAVSKYKPTAQMEFCLPEHATYTQLVDVVKKYLIENPAERHEEASILIFFALQNIFPCGKNIN